MNFYADLHVAGEETWAKKAFNEVSDMEDSSYYISRIKMIINTLGVEGVKDLEDKLAIYTANAVNAELEKVKKTCFSLNKVSAENPTRKSVLFGSDGISKVYHEFITLNAGLGNRTALPKYPKFVTCPICKDPESNMNEIHMLLICTELKKEREDLGIQRFIEDRKEMKVARIYQAIWREAETVEELKLRVKAAESMREAFFNHLGTHVIIY